MQVTVNGANNEAEAAKIARSVASSSLVKVCWRFFFLPILQLLYSFISEGQNDHIIYVRPLCLEETQTGDVLLAQLAIQAYNLMQIDLIFLWELFH